MTEASKPVLRYHGGKFSLAQWIMSIFPQHRHTTTSRIASGRGSTLRNEIAWINPACSAALVAEAAQLRLFA